ncbi:unnamed protein product [Owenia fusiformis]|uniref:Nucleolar protein 11 n=1 Tax=Owenia fusiformis TaxID=6347 RepID=A0A8S4PMT7_OWEFU|nr:unnamed protein product [Owenia fusiformis]
MAVKSFATLCPLLKNDVLLDVLHHQDDNHVIVTSKRSGVTTHEVSNQKVLSSWKLSENKGHEITSPAVYNKESGTYHMVINYKEIWTWTDNTNNLEKSKKIKTSYKIHRLFSLEGHGTVVLLENGAACLLSELKDKQLIGRITAGETLHWWHVGTLGQTLYVLFVTLDTEGKVRLYQQWFPPSGAVENVSQLKRETDDNQFVSCTIQNYKDQLKILSLWSDGCLCSCVVSPSTDFKIELKNLHLIPNLGSKPFIVALGASHIAVSDMTNAQQPKQDGIGVWDSKYGTLQEWTVFPDPTNRGQAIYKQDHNLYIPSSNALWVCDYENKESNLKMSLGKYPSTDTNASLTAVWDVEDMINQKAPNASCIDLLQQLIDPNKTSSPEEFKDVFAQFFKMSHKESNRHLLSAKNVGILLNRIIGERGFLEHTRLQFKQLLDKKTIGFSVCPLLFERLMERNSLELMSFCLEKVQNIPEGVALQCLQYFLRKQDSDFKGDKGKLKEYEKITELAATDLSCPFEESKAIAINHIIKLPFNDIFLLESMRKLEYSEALLILKHMHYLLGSLSAEMATTQRHNTAAPSMLQVVQWMCIVLDAHFTQFVISSDARNILADLHSISQEQMQFWDDLQSLEGVLSQLKKKSSLPQKQTMGIYRIEMLHIP